MEAMTEIFNSLNFWYHEKIDIKEVKKWEKLLNNAYFLLTRGYNIYKNMEDNHIA